MQIPRLFQLSGEKDANQRLLARRILKDLAPGEAVTFIVSQEEIAREIQGWAQAEGLQASPPKKKQYRQWELTIQRLPGDDRPPLGAGRGNNEWPHDGS